MNLGGYQDIIYIYLFIYFYFFGGGGSILDASTRNFLHLCDVYYDIFYNVLFLDFVIIICYMCLFNT